MTNPISGSENSQALQARAPAKNTGFRVFVWIAVLLVFGAAILLVLRHESTAAGGAARRGFGGPVTVAAATAVQGDIGVYIESLGTVTPVYTVSITSQVNGIVTAVSYREGQFVRKGELLVEIDPRPFQATLMQAEGTLQRDQSQLAQAQMDLARYREAWAKNAISKQTLDDQEKLVQQDMGTVMLDQGAVQYDQIQLGYCHIVAPIDGRVGLRLVDPGNLVQANGTSPLVVITQLQPTTVIFTVTEDGISEVASQMHGKSSLSVFAYDRSGEKLLGTGTLLSLDNQIDTTTGTVKARALFSNKDNAFYPNQFVNARLLVETEHGAILVPTSAIQHNGTQAFVYVLKDGVAQTQTVHVGVTEGGNTAVTGIHAGDVLANSSFDKLQNQSKVAIVSGKPTQSGSAGRSAP